MFPIHPIDRLHAEGIEYLGTKPKFWFTRDKQRYLFKAEQRGTGEDWAEKVVCELAQLLGLPHVIYELAHECEGETPVRPGVICPSFAPRPLALVMGNQLLLQRDPNYPVETETKYGVREHTIEAAADAIAGLQLPSTEWMQDAPQGIKTAIGVFCGYLMLDALVANQDRHHLNWGATQDEQGVRRLAPTYDHGSSLARLLTDADRQNRLETRDKNQTVEFFAKRARSGFYSAEHPEKTMLAFDAFHWLRAREPAAAAIWLSRLGAISAETIDGILANVPPERMSLITRQFTLKLLTINQRRLLESLSP